MKKKILRLAHSPDPDDAFMFWALAKNRIDSGPYHFEHVLSDIQTLNEEARKGTYEVSAVSFYAYPDIRNHYALLGCGSSMGDNYGPMVVTKPENLDRPLTSLTIAIPGMQTTAFLALKLYQPGLYISQIRIVSFDEILERVQEGEFDAGLIIHEGQLTYQNQGLVQKVDLGKWWFDRHQLPLPLGGNVIRRDLGEETMRDVSRILKESIRVGLENREEAVNYALEFGRGLDSKLADRFIGMYVNDLTLNYGERGRKALRTLFDEAKQLGFVPNFELDFV